MDWKLWIGPVFLAAIVSGLFSVLQRRGQSQEMDRKIEADRMVTTRKIEADLDLAMRKMAADNDRSISDRAWADYGLRRDIYLDISKQVDCLFKDGDAEQRREFHRTIRQARLVGSDQVVKRLNALTQSIKDGESGASLNRRYSELFNEMRKDIRIYHALPPQGTALDISDFPIES